MSEVNELQHALRALPWSRKEHFLQESGYALIRMHVARAEAALKACSNREEISLVQAPTKHERTLTGCMYALQGLLEWHTAAFPEDMPYRRVRALCDDVRAAVATYGLRRTMAWMNGAGAADATQQVLALREAQQGSADGAQ